MKTRANTIDNDIYNLVVNHNEYELPASLDSDSIVFDIGAHIGCFTLAALQRGAGKVIAIEPDHENAEIYQENHKRAIKDCRVYFKRCAIAGNINDHLEIGCYPTFDNGRVNTGGGQTLPPAENHTGLNVLTIDSLISEAMALGERKFSVAKFDCEGAEWPAIFKSKMLYVFDVVCGELHRPPDAFKTDQNEHIDSDEELIGCFVDELSSKGFNVRMEINPDVTDPFILGKFWGISFA
jgi:FkbM family methyltransferase